MIDSIASSSILGTIAASPTSAVTPTAEEAAAPIGRVTDTATFSPEALAMLEAHEAAQQEET